MQAPDPPPIPVDPTLALQEQQAQKTQIDALQNQAMGDTANLMARYGTMLAMSGSGISPMTAKS